MVRCGERVELLPVKGFSGRSLLVWRLLMGSVSLWLVFIYYVILLSAHGWMDVQGFIRFARSAF